MAKNWVRSNAGYIKVAALIILKTSASYMLFSSEELNLIYNGLAEKSSNIKSGKIIIEQTRFRGDLDAEDRMQSRIHDIDITFLRPEHYSIKIVERGLTLTEWVIRNGDTIFMVDREDETSPYYAKKKMITEDDYMQMIIDLDIVKMKKKYSITGLNNDLIVKLADAHALQNRNKLNGLLCNALDPSAPIRKIVIIVDEKMFLKLYQYTDENNNIVTGKIIDYKVIQEIDRAVFSWPQKYISEPKVQDTRAPGLTTPTPATPSPAAPTPTPSPKAP